MAVSTATAPELTDEQVQRVLVKPLEAASTFRAAGPRIIDTAGPLGSTLACPTTRIVHFRRSAIRPERMVNF